MWKQFRNSNYYCNELGEIKTTNWKNTGKEKIMSFCVNSSGYYQSVLVLDGVKKTMKAHRIIAETFIPNPENKEQVNHKNGNKLDNRLENLEWMTREENIQHCVDNKLQTAFKGEEVGTSKLKEYQVLEIRAKYKPRVYTRKMLADEYKVSVATIKDVVSGKSWKHLL